MDAKHVQVVRKAKRVCFFAHYHSENVVADHVMLYLEGLRNAGFFIVVVSTSKLPLPEIEKLERAGHAVTLRENYGLDFGGWIEACISSFPIEADLLLLANDSVYAPIYELDKFISNLVTPGFAFFGAVESLQYRRHLQSWFLLFRPEAYNSNAFRKKMLTPMPRDLPKREVIERYEIGLSQDLLAEGLRYRSFFSLAEGNGLLRSLTFNPTHLFWRELIEAGLPFCKIERLRLNPLGLPRSDAWHNTIASKSPVLAAAIAKDMALRGVTPRRFGRELTVLSPAGWREVNWIMRREFRQHMEGRPRDVLLWISFYSITTMTALPRLVLRTLRRLAMRLLRYLQAKPAHKTR